jgi:hypothetical protein
MYPLYEVERGKQRGAVKQFIFVSESEYNSLIAELGPKDGLKKAKKLEYDRIKARRISATPELRRKWSERRKWRRHNEDGLRDRERKLDNVTARRRYHQRKSHLTAAP